MDLARTNKVRLIHAQPAHRGLSATAFKSQIQGLRRKQGTRP
jgi:hypothetical protein